MLGRATAGVVITRVWVVAVVVVALAIFSPGCAPKPPYRVAAPAPPSAEQLRRLGRIELAPEPAGGPAEGTSSAAPRPRVWVEIPDHRVASGVVLGLAAGAITGALIGGSGGGWLAGAVAAGYAAVGAPIGGLAGGTVAALMGPSPARRRASAVLVDASRSADLPAAARRGAATSPLLARGPSYGGGPGAAVTVDVIFSGTRASGSRFVRPFVAVRTRLVEGDSGAGRGGGRVIYQGTRDWNGPRRTFTEWSADGGAAFRAALEEGAERLGRESVDALLAPAGR